MSARPADTISAPGRVDADTALTLVAPDEREPGPAAAVSGELVAPAEELVAAFALTLVARAQTQRTYQRACRRFVRWLGRSRAQRI